MPVETLTKFKRIGDLQPTDFNVVEIPKLDMVPSGGNPAVDDLVERAQGVERITNLRIKAFVVSLLQEIKGMMEDVSHSEKESAKPFEMILDRLKAASKPLRDNLEKEDARLRKILVDYATVEWKESERIAAENKAKEAALEQQMAAIDTREAAAVGDAEATAEINLERVLLARQATAPKEELPEKTAGVSTGMVWRYAFIGENFEEKDASLRKAYLARPELFDVTPRNREINAEMKEHGDKLVIAGMKFYQEVGIRIRNKK